MIDTAAVSLILIWILFIVAVFVPSRKSIFRNARVGCTSLETNSSGIHGCSLLSRRRLGFPQPCTYEDCPKRKGDI